MPYFHEKDDEQPEVGRGWIISFITGAILWCALLGVIYILIK